MNLRFYKTREQRLEEALRTINHLQHSLAIELEMSVNQPRIEYWTRKMESVICAALAAPADAPVPCVNCGTFHGTFRPCPTNRIVPEATTPSEPRFLTEHQKAVEEAVGIPLDWGMASAAQVVRPSEPPCTCRKHQVTRKDCGVGEPPAQDLEQRIKAVIHNYLGSDALTDCWAEVLPLLQQVRRDGAKVEPPEQEKPMSSEERAKAFYQVKPTDPDNCPMMDSVRELAAEFDRVQREAVNRALEAADKLSEQLGLELLAKKNKKGWAACDEFGHRVRALSPEAILEE
jgi:hypothetical protein